MLPSTYQVGQQVVLSFVKFTSFLPCCLPATKTQAFPTAGNLGALLFNFFFFLAMPHTLWDLSSPTKDGTQSSSVTRRVLITGPLGTSLGALLYSEFLKSLSVLG